MSDFLNRVFVRVSEINEGISKYEFSKQYLGKSESYYAYLTSTDSEESAAVLRNLYRNTMQRARLLDDIARKYKVKNEDKKNAYLKIAEDTLDEFKKEDNALQA